MTFLHKVNKMVKDKRKGGALEKVISIKTMKRVPQITIKEAVTKTLMRLEKNILPCRDLTFLVNYQGSIELKLLFFCGISFHVTSLLRTFHSFPGDLGQFKNPAAGLYSAFQDLAPAYFRFITCFSPFQPFGFLLVFKRLFFKSVCFSPCLRHLHLLSGKCISLTKPVLLIL